MTAPERKRRKLHKRQKGLCVLCGQPMRLEAQGLGAVTLDHILPRSLGGGNVITNLRAVHRGCNRDRGNVIVPGRDVWLVL